MNPDEIYKVANQARRGMLCIPLSRLKPHPHQRELDMAHVANLQDKMNTDSFNQNAYPIMVAPMEAISEEENAKINIYEGGNLAVLEDDATLTGYFILAGLHRIEACRRSGILSWPAIVYDHEFANHPSIRYWMYRDNIQHRQLPVSAVQKFLLMVDFMESSDEFEGKHFASFFSGPESKTSSTANARFADTIRTMVREGNPFLKSMKRLLSLPFYADVAFDRIEAWLKFESMQWLMRYVFEDAHDQITQVSQLIGKNLTPQHLFGNNHDPNISKWGDEENMLGLWGKRNKLSTRAPFWDAVVVRQTVREEFPFFGRKTFLLPDIMMTPAELSFTSKNFKRVSTFKERCESLDRLAQWAYYLHDWNESFPPKSLRGWGYQDWLVTFTKLQLGQDHERTAREVCKIVLDAEIELENGESPLDIFAELGMTRSNRTTDWEAAFTKVSEMALKLYRNYEEFQTFYGLLQSIVSVDSVFDSLFNSIEDEPPTVALPPGSPHKNKRASKPVAESKTSGKRKAPASSSNKRTKKVNLGPEKVSVGIQADEKEIVVALPRSFVPASSRTLPDHLTHLPISAPPRAPSPPSGLRLVTSPSSTHLPISTSPPPLPPSQTTTVDVEPPTPAPSWNQMYRAALSPRSHPGMPVSQPWPSQNSTVALSQYLKKGRDKEAVDEWFAREMNDLSMELIAAQSNLSKPNIEEDKKKRWDEGMKKRLADMREFLKQFE